MSIKVITERQKSISKTIEKDRNSFFLTKYIQMNIHFNQLSQVFWLSIFKPEMLCKWFKVGIITLKLLFKNKKKKKKKKKIKFH